MKDKLTAFLLAVLMVAQVIAPQAAWASGNNFNPEKKQDLVKIGELDTKSYPKLDNKTILSIQKQAREKQKTQKRKPGAGFFSKDNPYLPGQNPTDEEKAAAYGRIRVLFETEGLNDNGALKDFRWREIFGEDSNGNLTNAKIHFIQRDAKTNKELGRYTLNVNQAGEYKWTDTFGKVALLPLYSKALEPYKYDASLEYQISDKVKLLAMEIGTTDEKTSFTEEGDKNVADIPLKLKLGQVASTKFESEWKTSLNENSRPQVEGLFNTKNKDQDNYDIENLIAFPKNNTDSIKLRNDNVDPNNPPDLPYDQSPGLSFRNVPEVSIVEGLDYSEDPLNGTPTYNFDEANKTITTLDGKHKFKYDFTYDVINGGKLTMTEMLPVTFDANDGKFDSLDANAEQKIVKEVEYDGTLTNKAENPTKDRETFRGWSTTKDGTTPVKDDAFKNITKAKTFYAIWDNNDIVVDPLEVKESFKDGDTWVNDFIPSLDTLKGQVKIKDAKGDPQPLTNEDKLQILDDDGNPIADTDLKDKLYEKLKEDDTTEVSRDVTLKAKVTHANGTSQTVDIPIKVIKNIYEAKTLSERPFYVPDNYVKVTLDPTTKAQDPQKTYYYVNPKAKVVIPGEDPTGTEGNVFTKWTMKEDGATGDGADYNLLERHQFDEASTITAQYEKEKQGIINIKYVDENNNEIDAKYHKDGVDYPATKEGKLGDYAADRDYPIQGPEFKGYIFNTRDAIKSKKYKDPTGSEEVDTIIYKYYKKVTTDTPKNPNVYFPVIFDANEGVFESNPKDKKTVYVYFDGNDATVEKVTFKEVLDEFDKAYSNPTKDGFDFKEWQNAKTNGTKPADDYEIQFKGWDWEADPENGYVPETFYAHYAKASALISYLDLDGKPIADTFKIDGVEYPTEKEGKLGDAIASDVFTKDTAPKLIGYKFNRIELNPANSKYALDNKATIKIYYEKLPDVIPEKDGSGNTNEKPEGYVEVKFVPTDKAKDTTEKIFYVNPKRDVTIPIADPEAKATYTFKEWKMGAKAGGEKYTPSTPKQFTDKLTTITATYEETENIIPYDPSATDPMPRPVGYVRVTFEAEKGLKLTEQKAYYVKKNAGIKLGNAELKKPAYEAETGYKFDKWDKEDSLVIEAADIVVTAKATKLDNVIPEKDDKGNKNDKPEGYKEVTFVVKTGDEAKGSIEGVAKFYVNPTEYVTINPPKTTADTGYEFGTWDKDATIPTVYDKETTITGSFNELGAVIPKTNPDGTENKQPAGYVTVTYEIEGKGGKIKDGEVTVYFVNPEKSVMVPQPKTSADTGYEFEKWDQNTATTVKKYRTDTTVKGNFKKLEDIIPSTDGTGKPNAKPDGYATVIFQKGNHGELLGQTVYYVNPKANKTVGDLTEPKVIPDKGYRFEMWLTDKKTPINRGNLIYVAASYEQIDDVIPKIKDDGTENKKPDGYITVTFSTEKNGKIKDSTETTKVVYVNPNKAVVLDKFAPQVDPNTGFTFADWDTSIKRAIQYENGDVIKAKYNPIGAVIPKISDDTEKPAGYVTVTFDKGANGEPITGTAVYYVDPNKEVTVPAPTVTPKTGYKQKTGAAAWDKALTQKFTDKNTIITAQYEEIGDVIPQVNTDGSDKPNGYVTVKFKAVNGSLEGVTTYYVNGEKVVDLTNTANAITKKPDVGYTADGGTWDKPLKAKFTEGEEITFTFVELADVIEKTGEDTKKPKGYVTVKLIPTNKATDSAEKVYFVNPTKEVTITNKPEGKKEKVGEIEYTYNFNGWKATIGTIASWNDENIKGTFIQNTEITAQYTTKVDPGELVPAPVPKKDVVTPKGDVPNAGDLIKNVPGSGNDPLPEGTEITYKEQPNVDDTGKTTAKVEVKYPDGKTVVVKVPITVVDNVVPQTGKDKPKVPDNYVKVDFVIDPAGGGKIADGQTTIYYVNPAKDVTIDQPKTVADTGYEFDKWDPDTKTAQTYDKNTTVKGSFKGQKDIIPSTNEEGKSNDKPEGYVTVTFDKGANGSLEGQAVYYVNPNAGKTLKDVTHPAIKPDTGFTANGWNKEDTTEIKSDITVTAQYAPIADVIPKENPQGGENEKPDGYITVKFSTEKDGKIKDTDKTEKIVYVNPNKSVKLGGYAPEVTPNTGFTFADWDASIQREIKYHDNDVIKAKYNAIGDVIPQENPDGSDKPEGYLTVTFNKGDHGKLSGKTVYYVKPNKEVTVPAPTVTPATGYVFKKWDQALTQTFTKDTTITAQYGNKPADPRPTTDYVVTELGVQPKPQDYEKAITPPAGKRIKDVQIVERPNVDKPGKTSATVKVIYEDGSTDQISVPVFVQKKDAPTPELRPYPVPGDCNNSCDQPNKPNQPNQPNQPNVGKDALNTTDHYQYLIGYPDGNFGPNKGMTRAEAATMFTRLLNERPVKWRHYDAGLSDIRTGDWYANTVGYAVQRGIVSGYPDGSFKPNKPITRAEFAAIASRFDALAQGNAIAFSDLAPSHWGYNAIRSAATKGWISGYPDNTFRPEQAITRAEVTAITNRMLNRHADLYWIDAHPSEVIRFGDVKRSDWYFEPIMEATMGHDFIRDRDKKTEHWTGINGKSFI